MLVFRAALLMLCLTALHACVPQADLPQLVLTSAKPVYEKGEFPDLTLKLKLSASASHGWTVTTSAEGAVSVEELLREGGTDSIHFRDTPLGPIRRPLATANGIRFEAARLATVLAPGDEIELPVFLERDMQTGGAWLLVATAARKREGPMMLKYTLGPGERTLTLAYKPPSSVLPVLGAAVVPRIVSNSVTFEQK
jgi:hypothetical protein